MRVNQRFMLHNPLFRLENAMTTELSALNLLKFSCSEREFTLGGCYKYFNLTAGDSGSLRVVAGVNNGELFQHIQARPISYTAVDEQLYCSIQDEIRLLEYEKLEQARIDSGSAKTQAQFSIYIAILAFVVTSAIGWLGYYQGEKSLKSEINIPAHLIERVERMELLNTQLLHSVNTLSLVVSDRNNEATKELKGISDNVNALSGVLSTGFDGIRQELRSSNVNVKSKGQ